MRGLEKADLTWKNADSRSGHVGLAGGTNSLAAVLPTIVEYSPPDSQAGTFSEKTQKKNLLYAMT